MRRAAIVLLCLVASLAAIEPATAAVRNGREAIGDSVMLGAKTRLQARGFRVDAVVSRQFDDAVGIVRSRARAGTLRRHVVIHLGTNGVLIDPGDCDAIARAAGGHRHVYLVTISINRSYRRTQNTRLVRCARRHANTSILDWNGYSKGHDDWFYSERWHLTPTGALRYAAFLDAGTR
jgi:hypothetical protein